VKSNTSIAIEGKFLVIRVPIPETLKPTIKTAINPPLAWTSRQREVLAGIQMGLCNKEIACKLNISVRTVKFHVSNILSKLGVADRVEVLTRFLA